MPEDESPQSLEELQSQQRVGFLGELWGFIKHSKKYWLLPIIIVLLLVGGLIILGGTSSAPFIYTLF